MRSSKPVKLGVSGLDKLLSGGFLEGSTALLIGPAGTMKSYIGQQFIQEGLKAGERCVYISTFQSLSDIEYQMRVNLGFEIRSYLEKGELIFVDVHDLFVMKYLDQIESIEVREVMEKILEAGERLEGGRELLHSLTPLFHVVDRERAVLRLVHSLKARAKERKTTLLLILDEGAQSRQAEEGLKSICDYVLATRTSEGGLRMLRVEKSLVKHDLRWHELSFQERGVRVHPK